MDIVCAIPVLSNEVCKTSSFTNDQKTICDFFTSAQWDVCPDFLCKKVNAVAVGEWAVFIDFFSGMRYNEEKRDAFHKIVCGDGADM